jgi:hypothetical protein
LLLDWYSYTNACKAYMLDLTQWYSVQRADNMPMLNDNSFTGNLDGICSNGIVPAVFVAARLPQ